MKNSLAATQEKKDISSGVEKTRLPQEKVDELIHWIKGQLEHLSEAINTAQQNRNYGREAQCEGMRDAFIRCLNKLNSQKNWS